MTTRILNRGLSYVNGDGVLTSELNNFVGDSVTNWARGYDAGDEIIDAIDELAGVTWSDAGTDLLNHIRTGAPALVGTGATDGRLRGSPIRATWDEDDQVVTDLATGFPPTDVRAIAGDTYLKRSGGNSIWGYDGAAWYQTGGDPTYLVPATGTPGEPSNYLCWTASTFNGTDGDDRSWCARAVIESDADTGDDEWALVWSYLPEGGGHTEFLRFSNGSHLVFAPAANIARNEATTSTMTLENIGAGNVQLDVLADLDFADLRGFSVSPKTLISSGGSPIIDPGSIMTTTRLWDGALSHDFGIGWVALGSASLSPGPGAGVYRFVVGEVGGGPNGTAVEFGWTTDDSLFTVSTQAVEDTNSTDLRPHVDASAGSPVQSPIATVSAQSADSGSRPRSIALRAHVTSDVDTGTDEYEGFVGLMDSGAGISDFIDYIELIKLTGATGRLIKNHFRTEIEEDETLTASPADGFAASLTHDPAYTGAFTVTEHHYQTFEQPTLSGGAAVTAATVARYDAAPGTHKAVDAATTKTTPGGVDAWERVEASGTIYYRPLYLSKTA